MADTQIAPVTNKSELEEFITFPWKVYKGSPYWVPPLISERNEFLDPEKNPFFEHAEAEFFLATDHRGEVVGRIAAIHNRLHNEVHEDTAGFFGFFDSINAQSSADALFDAAASWLKERGLTEMRGPASFSTNDECGLLIDGFDFPPAVLTPYTPKEYIDLVEQAGFSKAKDLYLYQSVNDQLPARLVRGAKLIAKRKKITLRSLDMKRFEEEVALIKKLYNSAWDRNWGFVPMTDAEIDHMAKDLKAIIVPDIIVFAECRGEPIGFAAAIPDFNVALKTNPSGRLFPGILKILWKARKITRVRIMMLGLIEQYRGSGADALMYHWIWEKGVKMGYRWGEAGWILEDNTAMNNGLQRMGFSRYKTLRMYDLPL